MAQSATEIEPPPPEVPVHKVLRAQAIANEMAVRDGARAAHLARERADLERQIGDLQSAAVWRFIAEELDRIKPGSHSQKLC
jgi:hypothetical protein